MVISVINVLQTGNFKTDFQNKQVLFSGTVSQSNIPLRKK
jgi:hypothetical protein